MLRSQAFFALTVVFAFFSIYITFNGFFLSETKPSQSSKMNLLEKNETQWFERRSKVVMILFDGLRFDYLLNGELTENNRRFPDIKLKKFNNFMAENPTNFVAVRARADAPTLTISRIPCIVAGNIPPQMDLLHSLHALPLLEDSFLRQLRLSERKSYLTGDSIWTDFFPQEFTGSVMSEGYSIKDGDVDSEATSFVKKKLTEGDFDFLLIHALAIDHMGHNFGLADNRFKEKMIEMDQAIMDIANTIDDDTTLILLGDHGATPAGAHGRGSADEMNTAIVGFNKKGFQKYHQTSLSQVMRSINETSVSLKQQDITSTMAMLMGVPIPYSNLGQIINDLYPAGNSYPSVEKCPEVGFETQLLHDNYLNTLQILNYMKKMHTELGAFTGNQKDLDEISESAQKISALYQKAMNMIKESKQCEASFHDLVVQTILKAQALSDRIYKLNLETGTFDMALVYQGVALLLLVIFSYLLMVQYLYKKGHNENQIAFDKEHLLKNLKKAAPLLTLLGFAVAITWYFKRKTIHCFTTIIMCLAVWLCCKIVATLLLKKMPSTSNQSYQQTPQAPKIEVKVCKGATDEIEPALELNNISTENAKEISTASQKTREDERLVRSQEESDDRPVLQKSSLFAFQAPMFTIIAICLIVYCVVSVQLDNFGGIYRRNYKPWMPFAVILVGAYRIHNLYPHKFNPIIPLGAISCAILYLKKVDFSSEKITLYLGLLLLLDFVCAEIRFMTKQLNISKVYGAIYLACFGLLASFHLATNREVYLYELLVPRLLWTLLAGTIISTCLIYRAKSQIIIRTFQLCVVLYLALLQWSETILAFAMLLTVMKVVGHLFKNASALNFLYPLIIAFITQVGLSALDHSDRNLPVKFTQGFIGLHDFNPVLTPLMVFLHITTTYFLGAISVSHHNQSLGAVNSHELLKTEEGKRDLLSKNQYQVIKRRNVLMFVLMFSIIYFGAFMKCYLWRFYILYEAEEKFIIDATIYTLVMFNALFMI